MRNLIMLSGLGLCVTGLVLVCAHEPHWFYATITGLMLNVIGMMIPRRYS